MIIALGLEDYTEGMQITVFGASGKVGSLVVEEALRRGLSVVAFVHSHDLFVPNNRLRVIKGDIYSAKDAAGALEGSNAVISCLGSWGTKKRNVLTAAMRNIIPVMTEQKIDRIITLTGSGAGAPDHTASSLHRLFMRATASFPAGKVFRDGEEHMKLLAASQLDWTTLRSPIMTAGRATAYMLSMDAGSALIRRATVARALVDQLADTAYLRQAPIITRKK